MKGISCCGDCGYYNWIKHKCSRCNNVEIDAKAKFYDDCPLPDVEPVERGYLTAYRILSSDLTIHECSNCSAEFTEKGVTAINEWNYCPNCGAKMEGETR